MKSAKSKRLDKVGLWVLSGNMGAIRFYEKQGSRHSGIHKKADLGETVSELLYVKESEWFNERNDRDASDW